MKTYWFTIAMGRPFQALADDLTATCAMHGIELARLPADATGPGGSRIAKEHKINGILAAPDGYDRIVYLDADTLLVDPSGFEGVNGAFMQPWGTGGFPSIVGTPDPDENKRRRATVQKALTHAGLHEFMPTGARRRQEWNSGVIVGDRRFMMQLAAEWRKWWDIMLDACDGAFMRDQISFKYAYALVACRRYGFSTIPPEFNCIVKRLGFLQDARILHAAGASQTPDVLDQWRAAKAKLLKGTAP